MMINFSYRNAMLRRQCMDRACLTLLGIIILLIALDSLRLSRKTPHSQATLSNHLAYQYAINMSLPIIHNPHICSLDAVDLTLMIVSSVPNFHERQAIRETWASMPDLFTVHSQRLFVIGYRKDNPFYEDLLKEAAHERDILYLTVDDDSSTLKEFHGYRWLEQYCGYVPFTFKTEDDLFVNSLLLHEIVRELKTYPKNTQNRYLYQIQLDPLFQAHAKPDQMRFLFGWAFEPAQPERNLSSSPYFVSYEEYPNESYPRYCSGFGYLMHSHTRNLLTAEALKEKNPLRFSDIFVTGILPERLQFACDILPFTYLQDTVDECLKSISLSSMKDPPPHSPAPVIVCSTSRHTDGTDFTDYHKIWSTLRQLYADRLQKNEHE